MPQSLAKLTAGVSERALGAGRGRGSDQPEIHFRQRFLSHAATGLYGSADAWNVVLVRQSLALDRDRCCPNLRSDLGDMLVAAIHTVGHQTGISLNRRCDQRRC
jgi:hypothetical protein